MREGERCSAINRSQRYDSVSMGMPFKFDNANRLDSPKAVGHGLPLRVDNGRSPTRQGLTSASQSPLLERRR